MSFSRPRLTVLAAVLLAGCDDSSRVLPLEPSLALSGNGVQALVNGSYSANIGASAPLIADYLLDARVHADGSTSGEFTFFTSSSAGTIDFGARVVCLAVDAALNRAWIGAVITRNSSTRPGFDGANPIHQVGHDVWFRVADLSPGGSGAADRTTSLGFEGAGGIATSAQYCATMPWANEGVPTVSGNVTIH